MKRGKPRPTVSDGRPGFCVFASRNRTACRTAIVINKTTAPQGDVKIKNAAKAEGRDFMSKKKRIFVKGMAVMLAMIFFACKEEVPVTGVKTDRTALTLTVGETAVLTATVTPANATVQTVTWSVKPEEVVELNVDGNRCTVTPLTNGTVTVTASVESIEAKCTIESRVYIENTAFIEAVYGCEWTKEPDGTVKLTKANRAAMAEVGSLTIDRPDVTDLSGIEYFTGLTMLTCFGTGLTSLNLSGCTNLAILYCRYNNQLTSLNVSDCTNLTELYCNGNQLTTLNVSGCKNLEILYCFNNRLTSLNLSGCTSLTWLDCSNNQLKDLDVSACESLVYLYCGNQTSDGATPQRLTLILTAAQETKWNSEWRSFPENQNVNVTVAQ